MSGEASFRELCRRVAACYACPAMRHVHVLGEANGPLEARAMFVGEAPGRLGAARTGVPFTSDQSGRRFQELLSLAGLERQEVFVTNAVLCHPDGGGHNRRPSRHEVQACSRWLAAQLELVQAPVVVTLGEVALAALRLVSPHPYVLRHQVGQVLPWAGRVLVPLYHPSPRAANHRPLALQAEDFRRLGQIVKTFTHR
ncbi:MAG TPA: uracil-DNA glycosylase [Dehalococcoidia bacterium]|nr:uracil-DNA glycosylase [Dehalococcoidia bacterium]